jgi:hypothetical protein
MSDARAGAAPGDPGRDEFLSALFAQLVMQQANLAMMLMGKVPNPQTGQPTQDLEGARLFIDQLEMLEAKTKGNLSKEEETFLKRSLMSLQMAFVEAVDSPVAPGEPEKAEPAAAKDQPAAAARPSAETKPAAEEPESKKKFTRKY